MLPKPSQRGSQTGVAKRTREDESHVRTNERTERVETCVNQETAVDASARSQEFTTIGDVIAAGELWQTDQRHVVVRRGEREPIPSHVRAAVWFRDRGECDYCPQEAQHEGPLNLDHIKPWSAGGADTTDNLRLLCEWHNTRRSNFIDHARPKRPATWWCVDCYSPQHHWRYGLMAHCPLHPSVIGPNQWCRVVRAYERAYERDEQPTWHERSPVVAHDVIAYCAHCNKPSLTDVPL